MRRALALVLAVMLVGGHVAGLQLVAWAGMFIDRVQTRSVTEALVSTVDGSAPCAMCRVASQLHHDDAPATKSPLKVEKAVKKADGLPTWPSIAHGIERQSLPRMADESGWIEGRRIAPEPRPPRI